jgi:acyl-coenzyme A thioesterase PaaI-like protein
MTSPWKEARVGEELREVMRQGERLCVACQPQGFCNYGVNRLGFADAERRMHVHVRCPPAQEGGKGIAHGGWICALMDELLGQLAAEYFGRIVTANLSVDFKTPVPIEEPLEGVSWLVSHEGRKVRISGELKLAATGAVLATSQALFITIDADHHDRHADWLRAQKAEAL